MAILELQGVFLRKYPFLNALFLKEFYSLFSSGVHVVITKNINQSSANMYLCQISILKDRLYTLFVLLMGASGIG